MIGTYASPVRTAVSTTEALAGFLDGWRERFSKLPSGACIATLTAQSALESGWWRSMWNNNPSNIKASEKWTGQYTCIRLNERLNGVYVWFSPEGEERPKGTVIQPFRDLPPGHPQTRMRAFETFGKGVTDKLNFLSGTRWLKARDAAERGDAATYVRECKAEGYFTAELEPYLRSVVSIQGKLLSDAQRVLEQQTPPGQPEPVDDIQLCTDMARCLRFELPDWLKATLKVLQAEHIDFALDQVRNDRDRDIEEGD